MKEMRFDGIEKAERPIFYCSFGKDSSAVLHGLRPWLDKTMVVFLDCGGMYPDIVAWADEYGKLLPKYIHVNAEGTIWNAVRERGWPVDVSVANIGKLGPNVMLEEVASRHKVREYTECINERIWAPAYIFAQMYQPDLFISGERQGDRPFASKADWTARTSGVRNSIRPIFDWTDDEIWEYIDANNIPLPQTYQGRQPDRRDCFTCFGHNLTTGRVQYLKEAYPDLFNKIFKEEGLAEIVPVMIRNLKQATKTWEGIAELLEE